MELGLRVPDFTWPDWYPALRAEPCRVRSYGVPWLKLLALAGAAGLVWWARRRQPAPPSPAHLSETESDYRRARNRVLVLGAGFGGIAAELALDRELGRR